MLVRLKLTLMGLVLLAAAVTAILRGMPWHWLVFLALAFSWAGDAMLSRLPSLTRKIRDPFLVGMGAFALAQMVYIRAFTLSISRLPEMYQPRPGGILGSGVIVGLLPVFLLVGLFFWVIAAFRAEKPAPLKAAALVYGELVCAMAACACSAAFTGRGIVWPLMLGGPLFVVSDGVIALRMFQDRFPSEKKYEAAVWLTYLPAQCLLLLGAAWLR